MNRALAVYSLPQYEVDDYRQMVGWGIERLARLAVPDDRRDDVDIPELAARMRREYARTPVTHTTAYAGMSELAAELKEEGIATAVLSNKAHEITTQVVETIFGAEAFTLVYGAQDDLPKKPDPTAATRVAEQLHVQPHEMIFVGDTAIDMETAQAAGMVPVGVSWGYREVEELWMHGAAAVVTEPSEIRALVLGDPSEDAVETS